MVARSVIAFRADASIEIGTGHMMRCLTLADTLAEAGADCHVLCRDLPGDLTSLVQERGHRCHLLPAPEAHADDGATPHSAWLGVTRAQDARDCQPILDDLRPDWLVVDHYALDAAWERAVHPAVGQVLAIDDLADRPHECHLLLDQNLGRATEDYDGLVPAECARLIGPRYALLRPEFRARREESLARRKDGRLEHILVSLGGVDQDNATGQVLDALAGAPLPAECWITVVLGPSAPWKEGIRELAARMPVPTELRVGVRDMAALMAEADLAIGAAGSSAWERCCLGLPTLLVVLAENQVPAADALVRAGAASQLTSDQAALPLGLREVLEAPDLPTKLMQMSKASAGLVDGSGIPKIVNRIFSEPPYCVRPARFEDAEAIYDWRYRGNAARYYRNTDIPTLTQHLEWMRSALENSERTLLMVESGTGPVAHVRIDKNSDDPDCLIVSICISRSLRGQGQAAAILRAALTQNVVPAGTRFLAEVHKEHATSLRLFGSLSFTEEARDGEFVRLSMPAESLARGEGRDVADPKQLMKSECDD
ncbi:UDP-2,4-diacetamido-2,4,6-trideoxy-beta-L-altropyranose hydrolase [Rhodovulum sp. YNF3179]|uniref:UDP-2,4-diacetamido-2,4, 6-trideoxy-beta-L-altropyranose hydrolase n=1 Tax=Rhodovulum sp. YNF3179 TaxID=3425127 RepID=UPI003D33F402